MSFILVILGLGFLHRLGVWLESPSYPERFGYVGTGLLAIAVIAPIVEAFL